MDEIIIMNIKSYYTEFMQDIYARSGAKSDFEEAVFTERMCDFLVEQAVIENYIYVGYKKASRDLRVDAWSYNEDTDVLSLFITNFKFSNELERLASEEASNSFEQAINFFLENLDVHFHPALEESAPGYELAREIYKKSHQITKVQVFLLTNAQFKDKAGTTTEKLIEKYPCVCDTWDLGRVFKIELSGKSYDDIYIDFEDFISGGVPCLPAFTGSGGLASYLLVMSGEHIANLYEKYGERLLEQNVRTFLQFRGNVNKGIKNTIQNEPQMFFAYNNGLTATAEYVRTDKKHQKIKSATNLQIVNGAQTTASIFTSKKKNNADLSNVYVQVKLTVVSPSDVDNVVPNISKFANTQNKVSAADFFTNHPFHIRIEEMSRRLWAPSSSGGLRETHWFYERARGQYLNAQSGLSPIKLKEFNLKNPRSQMFTKTDLAKFENSINMQPHIVSLGAQKNFASYANDIGQKWERNENQFNELYFKEIIAKAIIFRFLDKHIMSQSWYGGYKANIVTYTIAKLMHMILGIGKCLDMEKIWNMQDISPALKSNLLSIAEVVNKKIQDTPEDINNVTEWCKREVCWISIQELPIQLSQDFVDELLDISDIMKLEKDAEKIQKIDSGILTQQYVFEKGAHYWKELANFGLKKTSLSPKEMSIIKIACDIPNRIPSEKQAKVLVEIEKRMKDLGYSG